MAPTDVMTVIRDCRVAFVGKIPTLLDNRVVPCVSAAHIESCGKFEGVVGIITTAALADEVPASFGLAVAERPVSASIRLHEALLDRDNLQWKDFETQIHPEAIIEQGAIIAPRNVRIGANSVIQSGAILRERTVIGDNCRVGPGSVISCTAFEIEADSQPKRIIRQGGGVLLEDHVEIESNTTLVRSTFGGFTHIGRETKIDCQVYIAHDCRVGQRVQIVSGATVCGRVTIGDDAYVGPNCSIANGLQVGARAFVTMGSVVTRNVAEGQKVTGNFAVPHSNWLEFVRTLGSQR